MTPNRFRKLALSLPEVEEKEHMDHPDFRVRGKIFSTLCASGEWGMVKLTPERQAELMQAEPEVYQPCSGAWGRNGATMVILKHADPTSVFAALVDAWKKMAPKSLIHDFEKSDAE